MLSVIAALVPRLWLLMSCPYLVPLNAALLPTLTSNLCGMSVLLVSTNVRRRSGPIQAMMRLLMSSCGSSTSTLTAFQGRWRRNPDMAFQFGAFHVQFPLGRSGNWEKSSLPVCQPQRSCVQAMKETAVPR